MIKRRVLLQHASRACPAVDIPIYGTLSQTDLDPKVKLVIIICTVFLKFLVILADYNGTRQSSKAT